MMKLERDKLREEINTTDTANMADVSRLDQIMALLDHIDALECLVANIAAPIYSDEKCFALARHLHRHNPLWAAEQLHDFALRAKATIASAPEGKES